MSWGDERRGGGNRSTRRLVATVVAVGVLGVLALVALGGGAPGGGAGTATPTPTPTATATASPVPTATATPTARPSPTATGTPTATPIPERQRELDRFKQTFEEALARTFENEELPAIPVLATRYRETDDGTHELVVVWRSCDEPRRDRLQHDTVLGLFAVGAEDHDGALPERFRSYAVSDLSEIPDRVTYVDTDEAVAYETNQMDAESFTRTWLERMRAATNVEEKWAVELAIEQSGEDAASMAFENHHEEIGGWCEDDDRTPPLPPS